MSIQVSPSLIPNSDEFGVVSVLADRDVYLTELLRQCQGLNLQLLDLETVTWVQELRDRAAGWVRLYTLPSTRDEEWRLTDLSSLRQFAFQASAQKVELAPDSVSFLPEAASSRLVFVNGVYVPELSGVVGLPEGLVVSNLAGLPINYRSRVRDYLTRQQGSQSPEGTGVQDVFTALNTAGLTDLAVVWVPKNLVVETPIHLLFISTSTGTPTISQPRCLVVAESGSSVTLVEEYMTPRRRERQGGGNLFY